MEELVIHNPNKLELYSLSDLRPLQGDFKKLSKVNFEKMKNSFINHGFSFPIKIWTDNNSINWIIGGHQRLKVLQVFKNCTIVDYINTDEGLEEIARTNYSEIKIPCELVQAKDRTEAVKLLLMEDSRFGTTNNSSDFFESEGLEVKDFEDFAIQGLDLEDISMEIDDLNLNEQLNDAMEKFDTKESNNDNKAEEIPKQYTEDMTKPSQGQVLSTEAKMQYGTEIVNLTFTIPQEYAEKLENTLAQVPLIITGREREQNLRGRRLLKLLLDVDMKPL